MKPRSTFDRLKETSRSRIYAYLCRLEVKRANRIIKRNAKHRPQDAAVTIDGVVQIIHFPEPPKPTNNSIVIFQRTAKERKALKRK